MLLKLVSKFTLLFVGVNFTSIENSVMPALIKMIAIMTHSDSYVDSEKNIK